MRTLEALRERFGQEVFTFSPDQDKSMIDEDLHDITDIPVEIKVFNLKTNRRSTNMFKKYITASNFEIDQNKWYVNSDEGRDVLIKMLLDKKETCTWTRAFDNHFNISCVNETGERGNGNFKGKDKGAKWEFAYCPYCGRKIKEYEPENNNGRK